MGLNDDNQEKKDSILGVVRASWNPGKDVSYTKIKFSLGSTIEECVELLLKYKESGKLAYGVFNGVSLYSDSVSMDYAYVLITGKTKAEYDESIKESIDDHKRKERDYKEKNPESGSFRDVVRFGLFHG